MNLEKEVKNIFLIVSAFILILTLIYFIDSNITGFSVYEKVIILNNNSNFSSENINLSNSEIKLVSYQEIENITEEQDIIYYINKADYLRNDVTDLIKFEDDQFVKVENERLEFELDEKFYNNKLITIKMINGSESNIILCRSEGICENETHYIDYFHYTIPGFYNLSLKSLEDEKKKIYLMGDFTVDYIYVIEKNITISSITKNLYKDQGYIETTIDNINTINPNHNLNNQSIEFLYLDNGTWKEFENKVINNKLKVVFNSDSIETPILYNLTLTYTETCDENWTCSDWSVCLNGTRIRTCEETNCNIEMKNETEFCNKTIIPTPTGGSGGGGSSSSGSSNRKTEQPAETRILESKTVVNPVEKDTRILEQAVDHCINNIQDFDETKVDCGGSCKKCVSILTILPYTNYMLFILLLLVIMTLLKKGKGI